MDQEVRRIQERCLVLLKIVDELCRKHGIEYSLCGGSVVGAHLYGGCLPWDDDIDLMMTRDNYNRFTDIACTELPEGYSIHNYQCCEDFTTPFTKVMDDGTTIVQEDGTVSGVFLDITVYDRIPNNSLSKIDDFLWRLSQIVMIGKVRHFGLKGVLRNAVLNILPGRRRYLKMFQKAAEVLGRCKKYSYSELFGAYANTIRFSPDIFEHYTEIDFEGGRYMIVRDYVCYLQVRYNRTDFREPVEKQVSPHYKYVNFSLPYKEYLKQ